MTSTLLSSNARALYIHKLPVPLPSELLQVLQHLYCTSFESVGEKMGWTIALLTLLPLLYVPPHTNGHVDTCRSYCGNLTIDYPFAIRSGCGHAGFRDLLFCVNDVLMLHIQSGSYRVLNIDYAYQALTLHEPYMSTCNSIVRGGKGNGFVLEPSRAAYLNPAPDNAFMLIGCTAKSPLFQGFPGKHLPCRNVSGMGCEDYYGCPAWGPRPTRASEVYGSSPPECCSVPYEAIRAINLSRLECEGYSSAYSLAPLRLSGPMEWLYGIRVAYSVPGEYAFCQACEATGGTCGYDADAVRDLCLCKGYNSTSNCDSISSSGGGTFSLLNTLIGLLSYTAASALWMMI